MNPVSGPIMVHDGVFGLVFYTKLRQLLLWWIKEDLSPAISRIFLQAFVATVSIMQSAAAQASLQLADSSFSQARLFEHVIHSKADLHYAKIDLNV